MEQFLTGSQAVAFLAANSKNECYLDHPDEYLENDRIIIRRNHSTGLLIKP